MSGPLVPSPPSGVTSAGSRPRHGILASTSPRVAAPRRLSGTAGPEEDRPARAGVRFADVQIREYDRVPLEPGDDGAPKLGLGWEAKRETFRRLDSLERERATTRTPGKELHPLSLAERQAIVESARGLLSETLSPRPPPEEPEVFDAELDLWHMSAEGNVHHSGGITSRVSGVEGRVVITAAHGSRYRLNRVKPEILRVLERIGIPFDEMRPLENVSSIVYAAAVAQMETQMVEVRRQLAGIETALVPFGSSVVDCFTAMNQAMQALGFPAV